MLDEENKKFTLKDFILQLLFIVLFLFILMWLFPTKQFMTNYVDGALDKKLDQKLDPIYARFFNENIGTMQDVAKSYFTTERLPKNIGDKKKITLGEMLDNHLLVEFTDSKGESCNRKESYAEVTKDKNEYVMKVNLNCTDNSDYVLVHMGCYQYCTTAICEKQATTTVVQNTVNNAPKTVTKSVNNKNYSCEYQKVTDAKWGNYSDWSEWTSSKIDKTNYNQVETKTVKVYVGTNTVAEEKVLTKEAAKKVKTTYYCDNSYNNAGTYTKNTTCTKSALSTAKASSKADYVNGVSKKTTSTTSCNRISNAHYATGYKTNWSSYSWYDSYKAANSGWKCTSSRKVKVAGSTYKTQWYCASSSKTSYKYVDYYYYTCPSGCYKSGDKCYKNVTNTSWSCPSGYSKASGSGANLKCYKNTSKTVYECPSGYDNAGTYSNNVTCKKSAPAKVQNIPTYECPSDYDNTGIYTKPTTCKKTLKTYKDVKQYKDVTYYRQKVRKMINGTKDVKWSNCNDTNLMNKGYSKTGNRK